MAWDPSSLWDNSHSVRWEVHVGRKVGISHLHNLSVRWWALWDVVIELRWYRCKEWSIRWVVHFDEQYYLYVYTQGLHNHQTTELVINHRGLLFHHDLSQRDQLSLHIIYFPNCKKILMSTGHFKDIIPEPKHGNNAPLLQPSTWPSKLLLKEIFEKGN